MNLSSDSMSIGFLVGIYFLASAVVALTLVYFSRPRPQNQTTKNEGHHEKPDNYKNRSISGTTKPNLIVSIRQLFKSKNRARVSNSVAKKEVLSSQHVSSAKIAQKSNDKATQKEKVSLKKQPGIEKRPSSKIDAEENRPYLQPESDKPTSSVNTSPALPVTNEVKTVLSQHSVRVKPVENKEVSPNLSRNESTDESQVTTANLATKDPVVSKVDTVPIIGDVLQKDQLQANLVKQPLLRTDPPEKTNQVETAVETKSVKDAAYVTPSIKIVNEKAGKNEMEDKAKEVKTSNNDFSDLFAGNEDEDNEISRLAKELSEIEAGDILDESLNLINEFKKSKG